MKSMVERFPGFRVFAGTEAYLLDMLRIGGMGCISATVNVTAPLAAEVFARWEDDAADALQQQLTRVRHTLQAHVFIPALKALLERYTGINGWSNLRPPLVPLSQSEIGELADTLAGAGFDFTHLEHF